tara:strand:- start:417 stop:626 length:210 start_codon:yes stop_codon:yes gene_type:complete
MIVLDLFGGADEDLSQVSIAGVDGNIGICESKLTMGVVFEDFFNVFCRQFDILGDGFRDFDLDISHGFS